MADHARQISAAVAHGLDFCCGDDYPLARIGEYLEQLQENGWRGRDRHQVEKALFRALRRISEPVSEGQVPVAPQLIMDPPLWSTVRQAQELLERRSTPPLRESRGEECPQVAEDPWQRRIG